MIENPRISKRQQKNNKILQKELYDLNKDVEAMNRRQRDKNNNQSESEYQFVDKKAIRWWTKIDQKHFNTIYQQQYQEIRDITTTNRILQQFPKQINSQTTYAEFKIISQYDLLADKNLVHALFIDRQVPYYCLCSYQLQEVIPSYSDQRKDREFQSGIKVTPTVQRSVKAANHIDQIGMKQIKLSLSGMNDDEFFGRRALEYKQMMRDKIDKNEIERELLLWQRQLTQVNLQNHSYWDKLITNIKSKSQDHPVSETEIQTIKEQLMWATVLKYLEHGLPDKTMQMLQSLIQSYKLIRPAKSKDTNNKKFFETDCKICFCSLNNDCNQVLYCDKCNTSFHLACYGLKEIPKEEVYYCDCCKFQKENEKKVICQLCNRSSFPIKELEGHFYHATCLLLLNLVDIKGGSLALRQGTNHHRILEMVVKSQIQNRECQFCYKGSGFRFKCSSKGCNNSSHPICAYLNGCRYDVHRDNKNQRLDVSYYCNNHDISRNWIEQIYIRRYMCNLNETADLNWSDFLKNFQKDKQKQSSKSFNNYKWSLNRIIGKTNLIKKILHKQQTKGNQNNQVLTQSGRMLQKLKTIKQGK